VLWESAVHAMQRADPDPPVVVVNGDLLAHQISRRDTTPTAVAIARRLDRAFPRAQFVLALGNNDSACGDYALAPGAKFLQAVAAAWGPLINRRGAAPDFMRTFVHDGFYTATLPIAGLHAIVVDNVYWSPRYRAGCGKAGNVVNASFTELESALHTIPGPVWVLFHIPPGIDTFSTALISKRTVLVPFLRPDLRDRFTADLADKHIVLAVAGHTHKFAYRVVDASGPNPVPMLLVPAISPIFGNQPAFLTADVTGGGTLRNVEVTAFKHGRWSDIGGMRSLGVDAFTGKALVDLEARLAANPALRPTFERLYNAGAPSEINDRNWPIYWCAATAFGTTPFRNCTQAGGFSFITQRGLEAFGGVLLFVIAAVIAIDRWQRRRRLGL
jgi:sphingomyelin phosphodiesterase acid-like 3